MVGDVDGDGMSDVAVGFPFEGPNSSGAVHVYSVATGQRIRLVSGAVTARLGESVCGVGDVNFDGVPDFAAGGPQLDTTGPGGGANSGVVQVFSGANGALLWAASLGGPNSFCGRSIAALGDPDNDGRPSIAIASPGVENVYILEILGGPGLVTLSPTFTGFEFGASIAAVGDLDGDGARDLVVGVPGFFPLLDFTQYGAVLAYSSVSGNLLWQIQGVTASGLGQNVADAGDVDLDGVGDVVATGDESLGERMVISGATGAMIVTGSSDGPRTSFALAVGEDADGNGLPDLWVGNSAIRRFADARGPATQTLDPQSGYGYGSAVALLGDLNGDGRPELAVGEPHDPGVGPGSRGAVEIRSQGLLIATLRGGGTNEEFGSAIAPLGDLDGDGVRDFLVGRPGALFGVGTRTGAATVYSGFTRTVIRNHFGQFHGDRFGDSVTSVPDADGDGVDDYAVGSPMWTSAGGLQVGRVQMFSGATGQQLLLRNGAVGLGRFGASIDGSQDLDGDERERELHRDGDGQRVRRRGDGEVWRLENAEVRNELEVEQVEPHRERLGDVERERVLGELAVRSDESWQGESVSLGSGQFPEVKLGEETAWLLPLHATVVYFLVEHADGPGRGRNWRSGPQQLFGPYKGSDLPELLLVD